MEIAITRKDNNIVTIKNYEDIENRGEIAHILAEIELIRNELIELWECYEDEN